MPALKAAILAKYWLKWLKFWNKPSISLMSFIPVSSWTAYLDHIRYKSIFQPLKTVDVNATSKNSHC